MSTLIVPSGGGFMGGLVGRSVAESVKVMAFSGNGAYSIEKLPTDNIGSTSVTFSGVNANSEIRVYLPDTTEVAGVENSLANPELTWAVYSIGSDNNTVRIVIIHPNYKIREFNYVSAIGNQLIPVQQELDNWYSNP